MQSDIGDLLKFIRKQFLRNSLCKSVCLKVFLNDVGLQKELIQNTTRLDLVLKYPTSLSYQKLFLKVLIDLFEEEKSDIHDCLYEEYGRLVSLSDENAYFNHFEIENVEKIISVKEDNRLITDGSTGLRTWEASFVLSEWVLQNTSYFHSKVILELGSGIGLLGLVTMLAASPKAFYFSDCHTSVLNTLTENVKLNIGDEQSEGTDFCLFESNKDSVVRVYNLPWQDVSPEICEQLGQIDVVIAADIIYDSALFGLLISALNLLFDYCGVREFILSCTERNTDTLNKFRELIEKDFELCNIDVPMQESFSWVRSAPMKIFNIKKSNK